MSRVPIPRRIERKIRNSLISFPQCAQGPTSLLIPLYFLSTAVVKWPPVGTFFYREPYSSKGPCSFHAQGRPKFISLTELWHAEVHNGIKSLKTTRIQFGQKIYICTLLSNQP